MKIDATFKPWLSVSDDSSRLSVCGAYFDKDAALLIATDGKMLTRYPVEDIADDEAGIIPVEALKAAAQLGKKSGNAVMMVKGGTVTLLDGRSWPTIKMTFPNWQQVLPNFTMPRTRTARLYLNPELLADLFKSLAGGKGGAIIEFGIDEDDDARQGPMLVTLPNTRALPGVLMPMRLDDRYPNRVDDLEEAFTAALIDNAKTAPAAGELVPIKEIVLERAEGPSAECVAVTVKSWHDAACQLMCWARTAPGGRAEVRARAARARRGAGGAPSRFGRRVRPRGDDRPPCRASGGSRPDLFRANAGGGFSAPGCRHVGRRDEAAPENGGLTMETKIDDRCPRCVDDVITMSVFLYDRRWIVGVDGRRHWARDGKGVCGVETLVRS